MHNGSQWGGANQPWGDPQRPAPPQTHPWANPQHWGGQAPPPPKKPSSHTGLIIGIVLAVVILPALAAIVVPIILLRGGGSMAMLEPIDPEEAPQILDTQLPCRHRCKFQSIGVHDNWLYVKVASEDIAGRTLTYRVFRTTAELEGSSDIGGDLAPLDVDAIEWSLVTKLRRELDREAVGGRKVNNVMILPCVWDQKEGKAKPCIQASVLTDKGDERRIIDASTGAPYP